MEVHAHTHPSSSSGHRKKWTHYLWEFLMLFLAVFCGFLAEYQLEHKIEREREKQYMQSMLKDLDQDIVNINLYIKQKNRDIQIADSLTEFLSISDYTNKTKYIYFLARRFSYSMYPFYLTDGTLTQLKNSGGLRLIHIQLLVDSLQDYVNKYRGYEETLRKLEEDQLRYYRDAMIQVFDVKVFNTMIKLMNTEMPEGNPKLFNNSPVLINEFLMRIHLLKRNKMGGISSLTSLKGSATRLLQQIRDAYHLK